MLCQASLKELQDFFITFKGPEWSALKLLFSCSFVFRWTSHTAIRIPQLSRGRRLEQILINLSNQKPGQTTRLTGQYCACRGGKREQGSEYGTPSGRFVKITTLSFNITRIGNTVLVSQLINSPSNGPLEGKSNLCSFNCSRICSSRSVRSCTVGFCVASSALYCVAVYASHRLRAFPTSAGLESCVPARRLAAKRVFWRTKTSQSLRASSAQGPSRQKAHKLASGKSSYLEYIDLKNFHTELG